MSGCKIDRKRGVITIMFNFLFNKNKENSHMARTKTTKTSKIRNLFAKGNSVSWKSLRTTFDLRSPASMVGKLRNEGMMIYENRSTSGVSYRVGAPSKAVIAAGQTALFGNQGYSA